MRNDCRIFVSVCEMFVEYNILTHIPTDNDLYTYVSARHLHESVLSGEACRAIALSKPPDNPRGAKHSTSQTSAAALLSDATARLVTVALV